MFVPCALFTCILRYLFAYLLLCIMFANLALPWVERVAGCQEVTKVELNCGADDTDEDNKEEKELKSVSFMPLMEIVSFSVAYILRHKPSGFMAEIAIEVRCMSTPDLPPEHA
jgi:hypothetical protein